MAIEKGNKIKVEYEGKLEDGTVFDSSKTHGQPLEFEAGSGQVIKGFDEAVIGMNVDEKKELHIKCLDAYGERNPELVQKVPKDKFPGDKKVEKGMMLGLKAPDGSQFNAMVTEVTDTEIALDLNHPLAGKNLNFNIKIVAIN